VNEYQDVLKYRLHREVAILSTQTGGEAVLVELRISRAADGADGRGPSAIRNIPYRVTGLCPAWFVQVHFGRDRSNGCIDATLA
jgi:hypothetical protein